MSKVISIIIPCYNEERFIENLLTEVISSNTLHYQKEIIFVNDGSTDLSLERAKTFLPNIKIITHALNQGKGVAIQSGLKEASGELILIQDSDLEYSPQNYPQLLEVFENVHCDVVYGVRKRNFSCVFNPYFWGAQFINLVYNLSLGTRVKDIHVGHKVFRRKILDQIQLHEKGFTFCHELTYRIVKNGFNLHQVPIHYSPRSFSEGKKIRAKDGKDAILFLWEELRRK